MRTQTFTAGLFLLLAANSARALPCHGPDQLERDLHNRPSAKTWGSLGAWFGERQQFSCALSAFQSAVRADPQSADLQYLLGITYLSAGESQPAITELRLAARLAPHDPRARLALGTALNRVGREAEAEAAWREALAIDPTSRTGLDWLAKSMIARHEDAAAIDLLRSAPADDDLALDLSLAYSDCGQLDAATAVLNDALRQRPGSLRLAEALATVMARGHRYEEAIALLQPMIAAYPGDNASGLLYLRLLVLKGDYDSARPLAQRLLMADHDNFDALYLSGLLEREAQQYTVAKEHLSRAVALNPRHYDARYNLGLVLARLQQPKLALEQLQIAIQLDPSQAESYFQLAQVLRALGRREEAQAQLNTYREKTLAAAQHDLSLTRASEAAQALQAGEAAKAAALYQEAVAADPASATLPYHLALALDRAGDVAGERAVLERTNALHPNDPEVQNQLGIVAAKSGEVATAEQHFRRALTIAPHFADASINLGTLLGQQGKDREAEQQFRDALASNPRSVQGWTNLAATLASEARYTEARDSAQNAIRIDPTDASALQILRMLTSDTAANPAP